jgi:hypothetical protein
VAAYDQLTRIFLQAIVEKSDPSFGREKEAYKAMPDIHAQHTGTIWPNVNPSDGVRRLGPDDSFAALDTLTGGTSVVVLCYSHNPNGFTKTHTTPGGVVNTSDLWDFVVTSNGDAGGYINDVFVDTGGPTDQMLGPQGACAALQQRLL